MLMREEENTIFRLITRFTIIEPIEFHLPVVTSTNDYAKELLSTYPYVFVSAQHQTAGRGRNGRTWVGDMQANAYCSIGILHSHEEPIEELSAYMARGSFAVLETIRELYPSVELRLKYPNDVQARTSQGWAKLAGILVEHEFQGQRCHTSVVGIGVNIDQTDFPETITQPCTSLRLLGVSADIGSVIHSLRRRFSWWRSKPWMEVHEMWVNELDLTSKNIRIWGADGDWKLKHVLPDGRLVLQNDVTHTERTISDGDTLRYQD
jgi:biotin-[acetyl-CoA-carboxylase] ligase BirA-like protein